MDENNNPELKKIKEFIKKFNEPEKFILKIIDSIPCSYRIIDAATNKIEIDNYKNNEIPKKEIIKKIIKDKNNFSINQNNQNITVTPIFDKNGNVAKIIECITEIKIKEKIIKEKKETQNKISSELKNFKKQNKQLTRKIEQIYNQDIFLKNKIEKIENENSQLKEKEENLTKKSEKELSEIKKRYNIYKKSKLNDKEKKILIAICLYPYFSDQKLSKITNIKRPTVTAIKNRFKSKEIFTHINIINPKFLHPKYMEISNYKFKNKSSEEIKKYTKKIISIPEITFSKKIENNLLNLIISKKELKEKIIPIEDEQKTIIKIYPEIEQIIINNFSEILFNTLKIEKTQFIKKDNNLINQKIIKKLNNNQKRILFELIKNPQISNKEISKKTFITQITTSKIKKQLIAQKILLPLIIPDLTKIGIEIVSIISYENNHEETSVIKNIFFEIHNPHRKIKCLLFENEEEYINTINKIKKEKNNFEEIMKFDNLKQFLKNKSYKLDLSEITESLLFE